MVLPCVFQYISKTILVIFVRFLSSTARWSVVCRNKRQLSKFGGAPKLPGNYTTDMKEVPEISFRDELSLSIGPNTVISLVNANIRKHILNNPGW